jgi:hypothetical protein
MQLSLVTPMTSYRGFPPAVGRWVKELDLVGSSETPSVSRVSLRRVPSLRVYSTDWYFLSVELSARPPGLISVAIGVWIFLIPSIYKGN